MTAREPWFAARETRAAPLPSMSTPQPVKEIFRAGTTDAKCLLGQRAHKVSEVPLGKMGGTERPGDAPTSPAVTQEVEAPMQFHPTDGGRAAAGFRGDAGDCVTRAIAIALELPYREVYDDLAARMAAAGEARSARNGVPRKVYQDYLGDHGWRWFPTMHIGSGCQVHLRADELPAGRIIVRLSKHVCAVVDGVVHDTRNPSRDGTRCVYGYFQYERIGAP